MTIPSVFRALVARYPALLPHLNDAARQALKQAGGYQGIRDTYFAEVYDAVEGYLTGDRPITSFRNDMRRAMADAFVQASEIGYVDGGSELPMDDDTLAWLAARQEAEFGFIHDLFSNLSQNWAELDAIDEAMARANGYASGLDQILSEAKVWGSKNKMLTFTGSDGKESCSDCQRMKGKRHKASWWIKNDMVPGSTKYECQGYNCQHYLEDDEGNQFTI